MRPPYRQISRAVLAAVRKLAEEPERGKPLHLTLKGLRPWRTGDYRIVYRGTAGFLPLDQTEGYSSLGSQGSLDKGGALVVVFVRRFGGRFMPKKKVTISLSEDLAAYLRSTPNASSVVAEAVSEYRVRELEHELERAYGEDAAESAELNRVWEPADAEPADAGPDD